MYHILVKLCITILSGGFRHLLFYYIVVVYGTLTWWCTVILICDHLMICSHLAWSLVLRYMDNYDDPFRELR